jgi:hypothetical protein
MKKILTVFTFITLAIAVNAQSLNWMKQISGTGSDYLRAMTTDASGNIYVVGGFTGTIDFDPGAGTVTRTAIGSDIWLAKYSNTGTLIWGNQLTGGDDDFGLDIALDNSGDIYIVGYYGSQLPAFDFDPSSGNFQPGNSGAFFAKYTNAGAFVYAKTLTGSGGLLRIEALAVDGSSNIYISGSLSSGSTVDFDPNSGTQNRSATNGQIFYAKYNSSGSFLWAKNTGSASGNQCYDLALDASNNLFVTGNFSGTTDFNPDGVSTNFTNTSGSTYVAKYNTSGTFQWAKTLAGQSGDIGKRCATDGSGNVYVTGSKNVSNKDIFLVKYSSSGALSWSFTINGAESDAGQSLFVDGSSYVYIAGYFTGTGSGINFNPAGTSTILNLPQYDNDFFVGKYNTSDGKNTWIRNLDLTLNSPDYEVSSMRISNNKIVLAGNLKGNGDFNSCGSTSAYNAATLDAFITGYNTSDASLSITGSGAICNAGTFTFTAQNIPLGTTVNWSTNPSNLITPSSGTGNSFTTNALNGTLSADVTITAQVLGNCSAIASSVVRVGKPVAPSYIEDDGGVSCPEWWFYTNLIPNTPYVWQTYKLPNGPIQVVTGGGTSKRFVFTENGTWRTGVYFQNQCGNSPTVFMDVSVNCNGAKLLSVYPNPSSDYLEITMTNSSSNSLDCSYGILLTDKSGNNLINTTSIQQTTKINISGYSAGLYYLKIIQDGKIEERQIVIE